MCGRYFFQMEENVKEFHRLREKLYEHDLFEFRQGEVFPSQRALVLIKEGQDDYRPTVMKWGFPGVKGNLLINARREGIHEKYTFRPLLHQRCVIVANGFYEWVKHGSQKDKILIQTEGAPLFYMAGLYNAQGEFVIVTGKSEHEMAQIHGRTPIMMKEAQMLAYLQEQRDFIVENEHLLFHKV